ncbi:MAG: hypothetical protein ACI9BV_003677, partial [Rhodothermales bacterium]
VDIAKGGPVAGAGRCECRRIIDLAKRLRGRRREESRAAKEEREREKEEAL